jgi:hypothetical protein
MRKLISLAGTTLLLLSMGACTSNYSITMVHSEGVASDMVDESDVATPTNSASIPVSVVPQ